MYALLNHSVLAHDNNNNQFIDRIINSQVLIMRDRIDNNILMQNCRMANFVASKIMMLELDKMGKRPMVICWKRGQLSSLGGFGFMVLMTQ